jgi:hypothetical protein
MSAIQRLFAAVLPARTFEAMERESRRWVMRCGKCGAASSIWDMGGIRYLASGKKRLLRRCRSCKHLGWQSVEQSTVDAPEIAS